MREARSEALGATVACAGSGPPFVQPVDAHGRFVNLDGTVPEGSWAIFKWAVIDRLLGRRRKSPPHALVPHVPVDPAVLARPPGPGEGARLTWIGHASWLVQLDGLSLLLDPVFADRLVGGYVRNVPLGVLPEQLPRIDAVLVSHSHYDHLDLQALERIRAPVVAGLGVRELLAPAGLSTTELGWWRATRLGDVTITFVPAQHWSRRGLSDQNRTLWGGFVIQGGSATIYHSGDTAYFPGFAELGRRFPAIDAALLPIGAYDPGWFMERQHMTPEQSLHAFADLGARTFVAMHWGTFKLTDEPLDEPPVRLEAERIHRGLQAERVRVPAVGEIVQIHGSGSAVPHDPAAGS
jgi:L-ascorbate metabolism protein UlaG (beta-lactamase superfamily)